MKIEAFEWNDYEQLMELLKAYKEAIGEEPLKEFQFHELKQAIENNQIQFYVVKREQKLIGMCSVSVTFSTWSCQNSGVFEDFFILPDYRKKGLAREMTRYVFEACKANKISSLWVGCADVDKKMYEHLGFEQSLGNLLTWVSKE